MHLHRSAFASSDASTWRHAHFSCALCQCLNASSRNHPEKLAISRQGFLLPFQTAHDLPKRVLGELLVGYVATNAIPMLSLRNSQGPTCCSRYPAAKPTLTSQSPAAKPTLDPVLRIKNIHCSRSFPTRLRLHCQRWSYSKIFPRLGLGVLYLHARMASTSCAWHFYVQVAWHFYVHFYMRGTATWTFYVHFYVHGTSTCTSTCKSHGTSTCRSHGISTCTPCASDIRKVHSLNSNMQS